MSTAIKINVSSMHLPLKTFVELNEAYIDKSPVAWCGIETALLDLFVKEQNRSVERLLGLENPAACYRYSAVLGDSGQSKYVKLM